MAQKSQIHVPDQSAVFENFPHAVKAEGLLFLSGVRPGSGSNAPRQFSGLPETGREKQQGFDLVDRYEGHVAHDSWHTHQNMDAVLEAGGSAGDQVLRQHIWQSDKRFFPVYQNIRKVLQKIPSPSSGLGVTGIFGDPAGTIGIDAIAVCPGENPDFPARKVVATYDDEELPAASFYSQAVRCGPLVFTAGHIPIDTTQKGNPLVNSFDDIPEDGRFLQTGQSHPDSRDGPIAAQSWYVYNELKRTLENEGLSLSDTINSTVYLADIRDFPTFHRIHRHFFPDASPALTVTGFDEVGHRGCLIEIELTASANDAKFEKSYTAWPGDKPFYAPASARSGNLIYYSGIQGINDRCNIVTDSKDLKEQSNDRQYYRDRPEEDHPVIHQSLAAIELLSDIADRSNSHIEELVKLTVYVGDAAHFSIFENIFLDVVPSEKLPAIECVVIPAPGPVPESRIQLEAIGICTT